MFNSIYAILAQYQIVEALYFFTARISGFKRQSGVLSVPASLGVLSGVNIVLGYWLYKEKKVKSGIFVFLINAIGLFLSMSYTGIVSLAVTVIIYYLKRKKRNKLMSLVFAFSLVVFLIIIIGNF